MPSIPLLSVRDLEVRFDSRETKAYAVNGISFDMGEGERVGLVGESGCGKSTTALALVRLLPKANGRIWSGEVLFEGRDLLKLPEDEIRLVRGREIAVIFQDPMTSLNPVLTVEEQLVEIMRAHAQRQDPSFRSRALELLGSVGLPDPDAALQAYPHRLSGGMRQRVMIAIALALDPKLLIADEPTTALDVTIQAQVLDIVRRLTKENGTGLILITHDLGVVAGMTDVVNVMYAGYIVESGPTISIFQRPAHPYTAGLLASIPRLGDQQRKLVPVGGAPPDLSEPPVGCPFFPRCPRRIAICQTVMPSLTEAADRQAVGEARAHSVACHNPVPSTSVQPAVPGDSEAPARRTTDA